MISPEYSDSLFNSINFSHEPYFDRVDYPSSVKDMFTQTQDSFQDSFPPHYPAFRRMSADTQASSADSASPDNHKPIINDKMSSLVLPPIHDLSRPLSPETSDASSTRSPQWQQQQQHQQQHHQQAPQHHQQTSQHYVPQHAAYSFPPLDPTARRPQLHINTPDHRAQTASYPTPNTANGYTNSSSTAHSSNYSSTYAPYTVRRAADDHYRQVPPPPPGPPVVTPATLAAAVGTQQRRRGKLPKPVTEFLKKWLLAHTDHPYPTEDEKKWLCSETGLSMSQVSNWMINARRRILAPAAKANAVAAAAAANAPSVTSSATATAATPYYSRSPPVRTVSGSTSNEYPNNSHYSAPRRESYAPYPIPASRATNTHQPQSYSSPATSYPSSAPPYSAGYPFHSTTPVPTGTTQGPASASALPPALAPYSSSLAPFGDSHDATHGNERTKSPVGDFAYAPQ